jgi:predicted aspartyl protease
MAISLNSLSETVSETPRVNISLNGKQIEHIIDTGATVNVLSRSAYESLNIKPKLRATKTRLRAFNTDKKLELFGEFEIELEHDNKFTSKMEDAKKIVENFLPGCDVFRKCDYSDTDYLSNMFGCLFSSCGRWPSGTEYSTFNQSCSDVSVLESQLGISIPRGSYL